MNQSNYPFRISDISLPQDRTGGVYLMMSTRETSFIYIAQNNINNNARQDQNNNLPWRHRSSCVPHDNNSKSLKILHRHIRNVIDSTWSRWIPFSKSSSRRQSSSLFYSRPSRYKSCDSICLKLFCSHPSFQPWFH